jgi:NAD/NADP transhydrogenase alpha subunit
MKIAVAREIDPTHPRVAASFDTVKKFKTLGTAIPVELGAGIKSGLSDSEFTAVRANGLRRRVQERRHRHRGEVAPSLRTIEIQARRAARRHHGPLGQRRRNAGDGRCLSER